MLRVLSIFLIVAGLVAAGFGLVAVLAPGAGQRDAAASQEAPAPRPEASAPQLEQSRSARQPVFGASRSAPGGSPALVEALRSVPVAYEAPREAVYGTALEVTLAIDATGDTSAADALSGRSGEIVEGEARVSDNVKAVLVGPAFEIEALSPETQALSPLTENTWRWTAIPRRAGEQDLVIEVFALVDGRTLPVRTYRDTVTVSVSRLNQAIDLARTSNPLFMVLGGIGSVLSGAFGLMRFVRK